MSVTREELAAYADGELDAARAAEVAAAVATDPALAAEVEAHRALRLKLTSHFAPILDAPVPERLLAPLVDRGEVVDFAIAREARAARRAPLARWGWIAGPALAASVALALFIPRGGGPEASGYAAGDLARALDNQLVATQPAAAPTRILLTFRDRTGALCRGYVTTEDAGIACHDARGWRLRTIGPGTAEAASGDYRQAGSGAAQVLAAAQELAAGEALDAEAEQAARSNGWR